MNKKQIGPNVTITRSCFNCAYCEDESYRVQGDSGFDVSCGHPNHPEKNQIGDTTWVTPYWCPVLVEKEKMQNFEGICWKSLDGKHKVCLWPDCTTFNPHCLNCGEVLKELAE